MKKPFAPLAQKLFVGLLVAFVLAARAQDAAPAPAAAPAAATSNTSPDLVRAYLQVQEQLHATQLAMEANKKDAEDVAARNALAMAARLDSLEKNLGAERSRSQNLLGGAAVLCGLGLLAMLATSFMQMRTMNRLTESAFNPSLARVALGGGLEPRLLQHDNNNNPQLLATIERLERRLRELEGAPRPTSPPTLEVVSADGHTRSADAAAQIATLLGKGQSLLNLGQAEAAAAIFDDALLLDPRHAEALIKKGVALEKLTKFEEAVACYDRAIAADSTVTIAYLYKGGIFNRLERYNEALVCYEQALKTQEKAHAA
ncbi:MAG: hypothetical protein RL380_17 [Verrucomicrobiota bacterium]